MSSVLHWFSDLRRAVMLIRIFTVQRYYRVQNIPGSGVCHF